MSNKSNFSFRLMVPLIVNPLTPNNTREEWALAFYVLGAIMVGCNIFYCFFASAELQPWATVQVGTFVFIVYSFTNFSAFPGTNGAQKAKQQKRPSVCSGKWKSGAGKSPHKAELGAARPCCLMGPEGTPIFMLYCNLESSEH